MLRKHLQKHFPPQNFILGKTFQIAADLGQGTHRGEPEVLTYLEENFVRHGVYDVHFFILYEVKLKLLYCYIYIGQVRFVIQLRGQGRGQGKT